MKKIGLRINTKTPCPPIMRDSLKTCVQTEALCAQISCSPSLEGFGAVMTIANVTEENIESILVTLDNIPIIKYWSVLSYEESYI